ncbi:NADH-quinone oxidoreductase subunit NuoI [Oceanidesulfovibrio marinus]
MMNTKLKRLTEMLKDAGEGTRGLIYGYGETLRAMFTHPITIQYPEERKKLPPRSRAHIILTRTPDGDERCVACYLCSAACPVSCISMQAGTREDGRRYAPWFRINFARCIYCGLCEEACPTLAIQLTPNYEYCADSPLKLVAEKEDLLVNHGGKNNEYDFYKHAGVEEKYPRGEHPGEKSPVDYKSNLP